MGGEQVPNLLFRNFVFNFKFNSNVFKIDLKKKKKTTVHLFPPPPPPTFRNRHTNLSAVSMG